MPLSRQEKSTCHADIESRKKTKPGEEEDANQHKNLRPLGLSIRGPEWNKQLQDSLTHLLIR